jgi:hypothetical protein
MVPALFQRVTIQAQELDHQNRQSQMVLEWNFQTSHPQRVQQEGHFQTVMMAVVRMELLAHQIQIRILQELAQD